jgi:hypothetical protein
MSSMSRAPLPPARQVGGCVDEELVSTVMKWLVEACHFHIDVKALSVRGTINYILPVPSKPTPRSMSIEKTSVLVKKKES